MLRGQILLPISGSNSGSRACTSK